MEKLKKDNQAINLELQQHKLKRENSDKALRVAKEKHDIDWDNKMAIKL